MPPLRQLLKLPGTYLLIFGLLGASVVADTLRGPGAQWTARAYDLALRAYQAQISPHLARHVRCRFVPSCSQYSREAVAKHGLWRGLGLTADRLRRCRPGVPMGTVDRVGEVERKSHRTSPTSFPFGQLACVTQAAMWALAAPALAESMGTKAALRASDQSLRFSRCVEDERVGPIFLLARGALFFQLGRSGSAAEAAREVIASAASKGDSLLAAGGHLVLATAFLQRSSVTGAVKELEAAWKVQRTAKPSSLNAGSSALLEVGLPLYLIYLYSMEFESPEAATAVAGQFVERCRPSSRPGCQALAELALGASRSMQGSLGGFHHTINTGRMARWARRQPGSRARSRAEADAQIGAIDRLGCEFGGQPLASAGVDRPGRSSLYLFSGAAAWAVAGRKDVALQWSEAEVRRALGVGDAERASQALSERAALQFGAGDSLQAIDSAARALSCFEKAAAPSRQVDLMGSYSGGLKAQFTQEQLFEFLAFDGWHEAAFHVAERGRSRILLESLSGLENLPANPLSNEASRLEVEVREIERRIVLETGSERERLEGRLLTLRRDFEGLLVRAAAQSPEFASVTSPTAITVPELQAELAADVTLISYFATYSGLHAWVVEKDAFSALTLEPLDSDLTAVPCFADFVRRGRGAARISRRCADGDDLADSLYRRLVAPLRPAIRHRRLIVVPHSSLHFVPFGALKNSETGRRLIEDFTITYAPSASILRFLRQKESTFGGEALVLGDPAAADPRLAALPSSRTEALAVASLFATVPRLGARAAEAALTDLAGNIDVLHLAAHGVHVPASPRFSRIVLAPGGGQDGNLEVHEIYRRLDLTGVNLVVLSACDTALGERTGGDEIVGLTRAFLYAGASGVVSTLWKVDDAASTELMVSFYFHLKAGETAAEALRHAQLELLRRPGRQDPYYWAGFVLTGDPRARWGEANEPRIPSSITRRHASSDHLVGSLGPRRFRLSGCLVLGGGRGARACPGAYSVRRDGAQIDFRNAGRNGLRQSAAGR